MPINKVCFIGLGYVGLPTAALIASKGVEVHGVDINQHAIDTINSGQTHIEEADLQEIISKTISNGKLKADTKPEKADIFVIAVPTPFNTDKTPDLSYVLKAGENIAEFLEKGNLVILESTSPVGATEQLKNSIAKIRTDLNFEGENPDILFAYCPERILPGNTIEELKTNSRSIGGKTVEAALRAKELYKTFCVGELVLTNDKTAEMTKLVENSFRDVNIAFANELSIICDKQGIDVHEVIELANRHPRVEILTPATGVGGHCIPVDPWFIVANNPEEAQLIKQARLTNDYKPRYIAQKIINEALKNELSQVVVLGLTYKPNVDDFRESPAFDVIDELLKSSNLDIFVHDPFIEKLNNLDDRIKTIELGDIGKNSVVLINTPHNAYKTFSFDGTLIDPSGFLRDSKNSEFKLAATK